MSEPQNERTHHEPRPTEKTIPHVTTELSQDRWTGDRVVEPTGSSVRGRIQIASHGQRNDVIDMQSTEIDTLRAELVKAEETLEEIRIELIDVRMDVRHARDRETAAKTKAAVTEQRLAEALDA